jgi:hypothetical protein
MTRAARSIRFSLLLSAALAVTTPATAQEVAPPATPNADRLAEQMRILATDPRNVPALLAAGELSARLNDPAAAAGFFARAQALAPGNPRVAAGQAMVMVRAERPGEALRLFALAERGGVAMAPYASDRGLAYDLIGAQAHAEREHRIAMAQGADDETVRRYAYSLGISGRTDEAMKILDPLLRRSDRAAWRARAFILAMNGDAAGADRIAASMMGGVGTALAPFFRRLPALAPADKAFAVHFGELRRTPSRIADAQVAPPLPTIAQVQVAAASPPPPLPPRARASGSEFASISPERRMSARERRAQEAAAARQAAADAEAKRVADARAAQEAETRRQAEAARLAEQQRLEMERVAAAQRQAAAQRLADAERAAQAQREADARAAQERATREAEARRAAEAATASAAAPPPAAAPVEVARAPEPAPEVAPQPKPRVGGEDNVIARIMAGITIPASELGVDPLPGRDAEPAPEPQPATPAAVAAVVKPKPEPVKPVTPAKADPKAKTDAKAKTDSKAKPKVDPAKAEPARHWVQVAGGADVKALPKAWKAAAADAPAEFRGKQAWTTPLRFTNRLLAGPFKTPAAAQDFVNAIKKKGVSAFAWTSEAGQKIEKLDVK